jgi:hypothetical protein
MQKTPLIFLAAAVAFLSLSGCVEHAGYSAGIKALEKNDITQCGALKESDQVKECYYTFADGKNDPNYCLQAPDPSACVSDYASKRQIMSPCDVLKDPVQKYGCIAKVAGDQTGRSVEEIIADFRSRGASKKCLEACEETQKKCELPCELNKKYIPPYEKDGMTVIPTDVGYVQCKKTCEDGYISCRGDCLEGKSDPYFHN